MTEKLAEVTIYEDDEGFFGGVDSEEMEKIDVPATIKDYQDRCMKALSKVYPECEFIFKHESYTGKSIRVLDLTDEPWGFDPFGYETDMIQEICCAVYEAGLFWTSK